MFSIITPTYERSEKLKRTIDSVKTQALEDWEMIIVNDSPSDLSYGELEKNLNDNRIRYLLNEKNYGVNYARNRALDNASKEYVIFLDDDDYLAEDALTKIKEVIDTSDEKSKKWIVTNRVYDTGRPITIFPKDNSSYNYAWDYLISKKLKGDANHTIKRSTLGKTRFPKHIKQGEEWLFFYEIGMKSKMYYRNINTTLSDGYEKTGLNYRKRGFIKEFKILFAFIVEGLERKILINPFYLIYLFLRFVRIFVK